MLSCFGSNKNPVRVTKHSSNSKKCTDHDIVMEIMLADTEKLILEVEKYCKYLDSYMAIIEDQQ